MAVDPSSLMIFQAREEDEGDDKTKKKKALENTDKPKMLGIFTPSKDTEPVVVETKPVVQARPNDNVQTVQSKQTAQATTDSQASASALSPREQARMRSSIFDSAIATVPQDQQAAPTEPVIPKEYAKEDPKMLKRSRMMKQQQSREAAKGKTCAWHPWREAYAVCSYCKRPFCFQDIIEQNREYFCLEDIDNAPLSYDKITAKSGSSVGVLAGIVLIISFITFFYFSNAQILTIFGYFTSSAGLSNFLANVNYSYVVALLETAMMIIGFVAGIMLVLHYESASFTAILVCIGMVAVFTYQYTNTRTSYLLVVDGIVFLSFLLILISRAVEISAQGDTSMPLQRFDHGMIKWPNAGRF